MMTKDARRSRYMRHNKRKVAQNAYPDDIVDGMPKGKRRQRPMSMRDVLLSIL